MKKYWNQKEEEYIRNNLGTKNFEELAQHFNIPIEKVINKSHKMGLNKKQMSGEYWSKEEDEIIKEHFEWAPKNKLTQFLQNRTWPSIYQRGAKTFNLQRKSKDKYNIKYHAFKEWTPESAYFFGFILADGYIKLDSGVRKESVLQIEIAEYDREILDNFKKFLEFEGPISVSKRETVKIAISNKKIINDLIDKGIPSKNKTFAANWPKTLPEELYRHFIRGLIDGDGSICLSRDGKFTLSLLGTESLLKDIKENIPFNITNKIVDRSTSGAKVFCFALSGYKANLFCDWIYSDTDLYLKRKYEKYVKYKNTKEI